MSYRPEEVLRALLRRTQGTPAETMIETEALEALEKAHDSVAPALKQAAFRLIVSSLAILLLLIAGIGLFRLVVYERAAILATNSYLAWLAVAVVFLAYSLWQAITYNVAARRFYRLVLHAQRFR